MPPKIYLDEPKVIQLYQELKNIYKVANAFNVSTGPILRILKSNNIFLTNRRTIVDETFFDTIDTEEKAYWLGFLAADGCVRVRTYNDNGKSMGNSIHLKLSVKDESHIEKFKKIISPDAKFKYDTATVVTRKGTLSTSHICSLNLYSNKLVDGILKQGILPRKTFILDKPPISENLYRHYIRGFFDGDGCIYIKKTKQYNAMRLSYSIACASPKLRKFMIDEIKNNGIDVKYYGDKNYLSFFISSAIDCYKFYHYLYDNSTIFLDRKKEIGDNFIKYFESKKTYAFNLNRPQAIRHWTIEEINILRNAENKYHWEFLSGTLLPNKTPGQVKRMVKKLNLKHYQRRLPNEKGIKQYLINLSKNTPNIN